MAGNSAIEVLVDPCLLAYLAGAIDADGHITVTRAVRKLGKRYTHSPTYYHPRLGYTSVSDIVPVILCDTFGGNIHKHQPKNAKHRLVYQWHIGTAACGIADGLLTPYLRQKRRQAELVVELCALIAKQHADQRAVQKPPYRITPEQLKLREQIWREVTSLNDPRNRRIHHLTKTENLHGV